VISLKMVGAGEWEDCYRQSGLSSLENLHRGIFFRSGRFHH